MIDQWSLKGNNRKSERTKGDLIPAQKNKSKTNHLFCTYIFLEFRLFCFNKITLDSPKIIENPKISSRPYLLSDFKDSLKHLFFQRLADTLFNPLSLQCFVVQLINKKKDILCLKSKP